MLTKEEYIENARQQLLRADHQMYVSLKYTRTVDVLKNTIERLILALEEAINALIAEAVEKGKNKELKELPELPRLKIDAVKAYIDDPAINELLNLYQYLRRLDKAKCDRTQEFRRNVTMHAYLEEGIVELTIDSLEQHFLKARELLAMVAKRYDKDAEFNKKIL